MTEKLPLARKCSWCDKPLDRESARLVCNYREGIDYILSHGVCVGCDKKYLTEDETIADTERSPVHVHFDEPEADKPE